MTETVGRRGRPPQRPARPGCMRPGVGALVRYPQLQRILPIGYDHHVCSFKAAGGGGDDVGGGGGSFVAVLRVSLRSAAEARRWREDFQESSVTAFRTRRTFPRPGARLLFKEWYRCQRNQRAGRADQRPANSPAGSEPRHTGCPAFLAVSVAAPDCPTVSDPHLPALPARVELRHVHNHAADPQLFRDLSAGTRATLLDLATRGWPPAAARLWLLHQLELQLGGRWCRLAAADRAIVPPLKTVCDLYRTRIVAGDEPPLDLAGSADDPTAEIFTEVDPPAAADLNAGEFYQSSARVVELILEPDDPDCAADPPSSAPSGGPSPSLSALSGGPSPSSSGSRRTADLRRISVLCRCYTSAMSDRGGCARVVQLQTERTGDQVEWAAAVVTPLMRRVHCQLSGASQVALLDSAGPVRRHGHCCWLLVCAADGAGEASAARRGNGGAPITLPLAALIGSVDSTRALMAALRLVQGMLGPQAFCGRGPRGPQVILTDDSSAERGAVSCCFGSCLSVLSTRHLLRAVWLWLHQRRPPTAAVEEEDEEPDRSRQLQLARRLLLSGCETQLVAEYRAALSDRTVARHTHFRRQFDSIYRHRHLWAVWCSSDVKDVAADADDDESTFSLHRLAAATLGDRLAQMAGQYPPPETVDFLLRNADQYYVQRVRRRLDGRPVAEREPPLSPGEGCSVTAVDEHVWRVVMTSAGGCAATCHEVHADIDCCTCPEGARGGPCVHQEAVAAQQSLPTHLASSEADKLRTIVSDLPLFDAPAPVVSQCWVQAVRARLSADSGEGAVQSLADAASPEDVEMSDVICELQSMTSDLVGRLAADPQRYGPLVRRMVERYWKVVKSSEHPENLPVETTDALLPSS